MKTVCYNLNTIDLNDKTNNILLNMSGGLLPVDLSQDEIDLLKERFGPEWFHKLGYKESEGYINPGR